MGISIVKSIISRIRGHGRGWLFSPKDFTDLGSRAAIDIGLHRLISQGTIRRIMRGIYDFPLTGKLTGKPVSPDIWSVAQTLARKNGWKILPSGETALNALELSTQIPGSYVFYTDGQSREYKMGKWRLIFRRKTPKDLQSASGTATLVIQALKALGKERVDDSIIATLRHKLNLKERRELLGSTQFGTDWIFTAIKKICRETVNG